MAEDIKSGIRLDVTGNAVEQFKKIQKEMQNVKEKTDEVTDALRYQEQQVIQLRKNVAEWVSILGAIGTTAGLPFSAPGITLGGAIGSGAGLGVGVIESAVTTDWSRMPSLEPSRESLDAANVIGTPISNFMNGSRNYDFGVGTGFVFDWLKEEFQDVDKEYEKNFNNMISNTQGFFTSIETQAVASLRGVFSGEINSLDDIWETTLNGMEGLWGATLTNLQQSLVNWMSQSLVDLGKWGLKEIAGSIFGGTSGPIIDEVKGFLGLGGKTSVGDGLFSSAGGAASLASGASKAVSWISSLFGGNAALDAGSGGLEAGMEYFGGSLTENAGLLAGGFAGPTALMGYAAAPIVIGNLFGDEIGSGLNAVFGSNFGEAYTPETAQERISQDFEALDAAFANLTQSAQTMGDMFGGYLTPEVMNTATEIQNLADIAGYSQAELDAMAEGLGQGGAVFVSAAQLAQDLSYQIQDLVWNFHVVNEEGQLWQGGLNELNILLSDMVDGMGLGSEATEDLRQSVFNLAEQLYGGDLTVEQITARLQEEFITALDETVQSGDAATESMLKIKEAITSIPTYWYTEYEVRTKQTGDIPGDMQVSQVAEGLYEGVISHGGGLLMHRGGFLEGLPRLHTGSMVSALAHDEVPVIARRGEYVVRAESVNAATLPLLQALNQTGRTQAQSASPQVNLHVEVHGNILGGQENMEELARLLERKLRDLDQARYLA